MEKIISYELLIIIILLLILNLLHIVRVKKFMGKLYRALKTFVKRVALGAIYYFSWLIPRKNTLVVFGADDGNGFAGNSKYLFLEAVKKPEIRAVWITKNPEIAEKMKKQNFEVYLSSSVKGILMQLRAETIICTHSPKDDFNYLAVGGATSINTWHGVGLKRSWYRNVNAFSGKWKHRNPSIQSSYHLWWAKTNMTRKNYVVATSERVAEYYPETYNVSADNVLNMGQARNDIFFSDELEEQTLPECFYKGKTIVYMPTHRNYGSKRGKLEKIGWDIDFEKLSNALKKYGYTFIIKQHRFNTGIGQVHRYDNIIDITNQNYNLDTQLILKHTDILITDYSSCYTDFLLLDRPVVFYCYDLEQYLRKWELNFDYDEVTPGPKVFTSDELIHSLEELMQGHDDYKEDRQRVKRIFYSPENQMPVAKKQMEYILKNIIGV